MAGVIKANQAAGSATAVRTVAFNFDDITSRANAYLGTLRAEAAQIVSKAQEEAAEIRRKAELDGRQAAMQAAERVLDEKVAQQMKTLLPALSEVLDILRDARHSWLEHWEQNVVRLAESMAARLIRHELQERPEIPLALIREALSLATGSPELRLYLNPKDWQTLGAQVQRLSKEFSRLAPLEIAPDPAISEGGCRLETQFGVIDQQFEAQLARLREELL